MLEGNEDEDYESKYEEARTQALKPHSYEEEEEGAEAEVFLPEFRQGIRLRGADEERGLSSRCESIQRGCWEEGDSEASNAHVQTNSDSVRQGRI